MCITKWLGYTYLENWERSIFIEKWQVWDVRNWVVIVTENWERTKLKFLSEKGSFSFEKSIEINGSSIVIKYNFPSVYYETQIQLGLFCITMHYHAMQMIFQAYWNLHFNMTWLFFTIPFISVGNITPYSLVAMLHGTIQ